MVLFIDLLRHIVHALWRKYVISSDPQLSARHAGRLHLVENRLESFPPDLRLTRTTLTGCPELVAPIWAVDEFQTVRIATVGYANHVLRTPTDEWIALYESQSDVRSSLDSQEAHSNSTTKPPTRSSLRFRRAILESIPRR